MISTSGQSSIGEAIQLDSAVREAIGSARRDPIKGSLQFLAPMVGPEKMFGIGHNYMDHVRETGATPPDQPVVFAKFPNSINGPYDDVLIDEAVTSFVDYEVELAVVIGQPARAVSLDTALDYVYGFAVANDVSARDLQKQQRQFSVSKSCDTFCPIGPWITTVDEISDPQSLRLRSIVNGEVRQDSNTADMIFGVAQLVQYLAAGMTLKPGDVILSGTPQGVGFAMDPPQRLCDGNVVRCEVQNLGAIENAFRTR